MVKTMKKRNGIYYARIRFNPHERMTERSLKTRDKEIAQKRLNELARQMERETEGLATPTKMKQAAQLPLGKHLRHYLVAREAEWTSEKHAQASRDRLKKLIRECNWNKLSDIDSFSFTQWRSKQTLTPKTLNEYLSVLNQFMEWLFENGFIETNEIAKIKRIKARGRVSFTRRAFTIEEIIRLLNTVKNKPNRNAVYLAAIYTGLRRAELESLEWGDVMINSNPPHLAVRASTTKNGKNAHIPLHPEVINALIEIKPKNPKLNKPVFRVPSIEIFKGDLKRAGIEYVDERGARADFHALRKTFGTFMHVAGVSPRTAQELMRHSDIKLTTQIYTDANLLPTADAINRLPYMNFAPHTAPTNGAKWDKVSPSLSQTKEGWNPLSGNNNGALGMLSPEMTQGENGAGGGTRTHTDFSAGF